MSATAELSYSELMKQASRLLPDEFLDILPPLYSQDANPNPMVVLKLFFVAPTWRWFITEGSPVDDKGVMIHSDDSTARQSEAHDFLFYGIVEGDEREKGYASLRELISTVGKFGQRVERQKNWIPVRESQI
jgi:hypothetical protein